MTAAFVNSFSVLLRRSPQYRGSVDPTFRYRPGKYRNKSASPGMRGIVFERDGHQCLKCGRTDDLTVDHIVPRVYGGTNAANNLQTLCRGCNAEKGARVIDYRTG